LENVPRSRPLAKEALLEEPEDQKDLPAGKGDRPSPGEDGLLEGCCRGDVAAFERLYERHGARMKSVARNLLGREADAEDAVQETFLKVYRGAASFRGSSSLMTWIYRILVNTCYDALRKRQRHPEDALESAASGGEGPALPATAGDHPLRIAIEQSLSRLSPRQRAVFLLSAVEGFSHREIAAVLDVSEGASRALLFEAKRRLQDLLWSGSAARATS
jgi:RNA polymerase sigma-70 factor, ECF subfamily